MTIDGLLANAKALRDGMQGELIRRALAPFQSNIVEQQRIQLLQGKNSKGEDMHPFYSEDVKPSGYFTSAVKAKAYAAWKQTLRYPYSVQRNPDAPNLYITGLFHDDLNVELGSDSVAIVPDTAYAAKIMAKYGMNAFGLDTEMWGIIWNEVGAKDELIKEMKQVLWQ